MFQHPKDKKSPDSTDKCKEHPPIWSDVQCGVLSANGRVVHKVCTRDDRNGPRDPKHGSPKSAQRSTEKWRLFHSAYAFQFLDLRGTRITVGCPENLLRGGSTRSLICFNCPPTRDVVNRCSTGSSVVPRGIAVGCWTT